MFTKQITPLMHSKISVNVIIFEIRISDFFCIANEKKHPFIAKVWVLLWKNTLCFTIKGAATLFKVCLKVENKLFLRRLSCEKQVYHHINPQKSTCRYFFCGLIFLISQISLFMSFLPTLKSLTNHQNNACGTLYLLSMHKNE